MLEFFFYLKCSYHILGLNLLLLQPDFSRLVNSSSMPSTVAVEEQILAFTEKEGFYRKKHQSQTPYYPMLLMFLVDSLDNTLFSHILIFQSYPDNKPLRLKNILS